jgi:hypothetical protein
MNSIIDFITAWKDLISKIFGEYPLAASLVTAVAVGAFALLERERRRNTATNFMIVLIGWAMSVPVVGFVMNVLGKIWEVIEAIAPIVTKVLGSFYAIYEKHPLLILALVALAMASYFVWKRWWPEMLPNRSLRIVSVAGVTIVVAHLLSPFADLVGSVASETDGSSHEQSKKPIAITASPTRVPLSAMTTMATPERTVEPSPSPHASSTPSAGASPTPQPTI